MRSSWHIASSLLAVDACEGSPEGQKLRAHPLIFAVLNLFFCGYVDRFLKVDHDGHFLTLFLFAECSLMILVTVGTFIRHSREILMKSSMFPTTPWSRLHFVVISAIRRPISVASWATTLTFIVVFFRQSIGIAIVAVGLFVFMLVNVHLILALMCLRLSRVSQPVAGIAVIVFLCAFAVIVSSLVFHSNVLLSATPILSWVVDGILAASRHENMVVARNFLFMIALSCLTLLASKRLA